MVESLLFIGARAGDGVGSGSTTLFVVKLPQKQLHILQFWSQVAVDDVGNWPVNQPLEMFSQ